MDNIMHIEDRETLEHEAREWLLRLDNDDALQPADKQALHEWMARSPAHEQELVRLAEFWDSSNILTELLIPMQEVARVGARPRGGLGLLSGVWAAPRGLVMAMSVLLAVLMVRGYLSPGLQATNGIYAAAIGELRVETLADGSVLHINTDSQVQVSYSDEVRKIRLLRGEAHFKVAHNSQWPFEVYAGKARVKAVGTAFLVRLEQENLSVIVTDGRVDLAAPMAAKRPSKQSQNTDLNVLPLLEDIGSLSEGQGASFNAANNPKEQRMLAQKEMSRQLAWREGYLVFEGESLAVVVAELNRYLPLQVEIVDESLNAIAIGGRFKVDELDALFEVLETSFNVGVSRLDDRSIKLYAKPVSESRELSDVNKKNKK